MKHNSKWLGILLLAALILQGCGRKGVLFMPKNTTTPTQTQSDQNK